MEEPTLQKILREKYNIDERLLAEGRFVWLIGDHATNLLCLGLGIQCLTIARVVLSGDVMDYELLSLLPLRMLSLSYQNLEKKIKVRSQFKSTQVYQMCTSANQAEVWDNFTSTIREAYMSEQGDIWCRQTLQPPKVQYPKQTEYVSEIKSLDFEQLVDNSQHISIPTISYQDVKSPHKIVSRLSESNESLPVKLPSHADDNNFWSNDAVRSQSMIFESFVNGVDAVAGDEDSDSHHTCFLADDTVKHNISNNFVPVKGISDTNICISSEKEEKRDGRFCSLLKKGVLLCQQVKALDIRFLYI